MKEFRIRLFGAFRRYSSEGEIAVNLPAGCTVADLRRELARRLAETVPGFPDAGLIGQSAFATESGLLTDSDRLQGDEELAVLPPVCGG